MTIPDHSSHGREVPPWQIGRPQSAVVELAERGACAAASWTSAAAPASTPLLAARVGLEVVGIDLDTTVLETARQRRRAAPASHLFVA